MTTAVNDRRIQYTATASQTVFPYDFPIETNTELEVLQTVATTSVTTTLTLTTEYTVSGVGVAAGGNVTLVTGAAVNDIITITGETPLSRVTDFQQAGDFLAEELNDQLDSLVRIEQETKTKGNRAVTLKDEDTASILELPITSVRASNFLAFDASGDAIAAAGTTEVPVSAFMETFLDDTTAAAGRTTLGVAIGSDVQAYDVNLDALSGLTGAADKIPTFTGVGTMNLTDPMIAGMVVIFPTNSPPTGWLELDGSLVSRTTYADLWTYAQTTGNVVADGSWAEGNFSTGDLSTTFRLPDARGYFIRGWDNGSGVDSGRAIGTQQNDAFQGHYHDKGEYSSTNLIDGASTAFVRLNTGGDPDDTSAPITDGSSGTPRTSTETRPTNIALMYCIKY